MVTPLGWVVLLAAALAVLFRRQSLALVVCIAAAFPDSSAIVLSQSIAISPYYVSAILLIAIEVGALLLGNRTGTRAAIPRSLSVFTLYALVITCTAPGIMRGIPVFSSDLGLDQQVSNLTNLEYTTSNLAQLAYLGVNALLVSLASTATLSLLPAVRAGLAIGVSIPVMMRLSGDSVSAVLQPIFYNNPGGFYTIEASRLSGQFSEPSHLGLYSTAAVCFFAAAFLGSRGWRRLLDLLFLMIALAALALSGSAIAFAGLALAAVVGLVAVIGGELTNHAPSEQRPIPGAAIIGLAMSPLLAWGAYEVVTSTIAEKVGTVSLDTRSYADAQGLRTFADSLGLGVGLGSTRASSLVTLLLASVGVVGTLAFMAWVSSMAFGAHRRDPNAKLPGSVLAGRAGVIGWVCAAAVGAGDLTSPVFWTLACLLVSERSCDGGAKTRDRARRTHRAVARQRKEVLDDATPHTAGARGRATPPLRRTSRGD